MERKERKFSIMYSKTWKNHQLDISRSAAVLASLVGADVPAAAQRMLLGYDF